MVSKYGRIRGARVRRFGVYSIVRWNSWPGKAWQAASTQPWSRSREARFKRRQRSVRAAMRECEAIEPRKLYRAEADVFLATAGSNAQTICYGCAGSAGV